MTDEISAVSSLMAYKGAPALAYLAGPCQLIKQLRIADGDSSILESVNHDFADIVVDDFANMKIHGVVAGRAGSL